MKIYATKLFRTSPRQDRIKAAVKNPINTELVIQLKKYLKDDEAFSDPDDASAQSLKQKTESEGRPSIRPSVSSPSHGGGGGNSMPSGPSKLEKDIDMMKSEELDKSVPADIEEPVDETETEVTKESTESATKLDGSKIQASTLPLTPEESAAETVDSIKGTLNADEATAGVRYASVKDNEAWIYYTDDVNLNNVMEAVIAKLQNSGYPHLEFNRLARSNNAIVFQIIQSKLPVQVDD